MSPLLALLGFTAWTLLLITAVFLYRGVRFIGGTPINHWPRRDKPFDDAPIIKRIEDAHANCLENLVLFAAIVLAASAMGRISEIQPFAVYVLLARVGQTLTHLSGVGRLHVFIRASFWAIQVTLFFVMLGRLLT